MAFTLSFFELVWLLLQLTAPVWLLFLLLIVALGQIVGRLEQWPPPAALYWSLITATTVGYGDMRPTRRPSRALAVFIALFGLILFGVLIAIAVHATTEATRIHADLSRFQTIIQ